MLPEHAFTQVLGFLAKMFLRRSFFFRKSLQFQYFQIIFLIKRYWPFFKKNKIKKKTKKIKNCVTFIKKCFEQSNKEIGQYINQCRKLIHVYRQTDVQANGRRKKVDHEI